MREHCVVDIVATARPDAAAAAAWAAGGQRRCTGSEATLVLHERVAVAVADVEPALAAQVALARFHHGAREAGLLVRCAEATSARPAASRGPAGAGRLRALAERRSVAV